jgi:hypothetical protein
MTNITVSRSSGNADPEVLSVVSVDETDANALAATRASVADYVNQQKKAAGNPPAYRISTTEVKQ